MNGTLAMAGYIATILLSKEVYSYLQSLHKVAHGLSTGRSSQVHDLGTGKWDLPKTKALVAGEQDFIVI